MNLTYHLGEDYRYGGSRQRFRLVAADGFVFRFACGHWCTDTVFSDLIRCRDGRPVYRAVNQQLNLFNATA